METAAGQPVDRRPNRAEREPGPPTFLIAAVSVAAAVGAGLAGCHPTGYVVTDFVYPSLLAAGYTWACSRADRATVLVMAVVAVAFSRSWLLLPAATALLIAFAGVLPRRPSPAVGALFGAVEIQVALRWPAHLFHGFTAALTGALVVVTVLSAWPRLPKRVRTLAVTGTGAVLAVAAVLSIPTVLTALQAKGAADRGSSEARTALDDVDRSDAPDAVANLKVAAVDFRSAHSRTDAWWTWGGAVVPFVAQQHRALVQLSGAGYALASGGAAEAGTIDFHHLTESGSRIDLAAVERLAGPLRSLDTQVTAAQVVASDSRSGWLVPQIADPLTKLSVDLARAKRSTDLAVAAVAQVPDLLGGDGVRHYLVVFMTPAETRGLGGFLGAYAEVTVSAGKMTVTRSGLPKDLVDPSGGSPRITGPADFLARYGEFHPQDHIEDVSDSPDFPTVADVLTQLYPQVGGDHLDGVLVLDPETLAALFQFTGPIDVPGLPVALDATNAADILLRQQYILIPQNAAQNERHDLLQQALTIGFQRLTNGALPSPKAFADALGPDVRQGRLLFWTTDPAAHPLLDQLGLDGAFPTTSPGASDVLAVTLSNVGNNKIDAYLHESVADRVSFEPATGSVRSFVTVSLTNDATTNLPTYVVGSYAGSGLPVGTNYTWLSLYTPFRLTGASVSGKPVPFEAGVNEVGVIAYSTYLKVPAGATLTLDLSLAGTLERGTKLSTLIRLQPLAYPTATSVTAVPAAGWHLSAGSQAGWTAGSAEVQSHTWTFQK